jgi:hypothetical protein
VNHSLCTRRVGPNRETKVRYRLSVSSTENQRSANQRSANQRSANQRSADTEIARSAHREIRSVEGQREFLAAVRRFQDTAAAATPPTAILDRLTATLDELSDELASHASAEPDRWDGRTGDLPGRGHPLMPPYVIEHTDENGLSGQVTFGRIYLGFNNATHGGALPLLFDHLIGITVGRLTEGLVRTAYLTANYRAVAPIGVPLRFETSLDKVEGRKRWASGRLLLPTGELTTEFDALFVRLRPGQA